MIDPSGYLEGALATLPERPEDATAEDLQRLVAIQEGLTRHLLGCHEHLAAAANGTGDLGELAQASKLGRDAEAAHERLTDYSRRALAAHGIDLDALTGDAA